MSNRPTILTLADYYLPGYKAGGPIQTIANIVSQLGDEFRFKIITSDRDLGDSTSYPGVELNRWITLGKAEVFYVRSADPIRVLRIIQSTPHDVLYLNSCFARGFSIIPMMAASLRLLPDRPIILAPRGEFSLGAIQIKAGRKTAYLRIARWFSAYQKAIWHASSPFEAADILRAFCGVDRMGSRATALQRNRAQIVIAPDIACLLPIATDGVQVGKQCRRKEPGVLRTVFLSRVSRKKNLAEAIRLLDALQGHVEFDIYGPIEDISYWRECEQAIDKLPANVHVRYMGMVHHEQVYGVFSAYDLFLFPTLGENFGHVIAEALVAGCPVLISDQTPWRGLISAGVGWDLPLSASERFREILQLCVRMGPKEYAEMRARAAAFGMHRVNDPSVIEQTRTLFRFALNLRA